MKEIYANITFSVVLCAECIILTYLLIYLLTYLLTYLFTYILTPRSRVLLEKLSGSQLVKKFPVFYGTLKFIIAFTRVRHLSLS